MNKIEINTKFDIGDSVYGFPNNEVHKLVIDRIEISLARFNKNNAINDFRITYLATIIDATPSAQYRFNEKSLFTKEELIEYVNQFLQIEKI